MGNYMSLVISADEPAGNDFFWLEIMIGQRGIVDPVSGELSYAVEYIADYTTLSDDYRVDTEILITYHKPIYIQARGPVEVIGLNFSHWHTLDPEGTIVSNSINMYLTPYLSSRVIVGGSELQDLIVGANGNDTLAGRAGDDVVYGGLGGDTITGSIGDDKLYGDGGNDTISGNDGSDQLYGGEGADVLTGGAGNDFYWYVALDDTVTELADGGRDTIITEISYTLPANFESLSLMGGGITSGTGNAVANEIYGMGGRNTLFGLGGNDKLYGNGANDILDGGEGDDVLHGGVGDDSLTGGTGNDRYFVDSVRDVVIEADNAGIDTVEVAGLAVYTLDEALENLRLTTNADATGLGNALGNVIKSGGGNDLLVGYGGADNLNGAGGHDTLIGGSEADVLNGGTGIDLVDYSDSARNVTVNLRTGLGRYGDANLDTLVQIENLIGSNYGFDVLTGNEAANRIEGRSGSDTIFGDMGNDYISGGTGKDKLDGGLGTDVLSYVGSANGVQIDLAKNTANGGDARGDTIVNFENVTGGNGNDLLIGTSGINVLIGGAGNDRIIGAGGIDRIEGGEGADTIEGGGQATLTYANSAGHVFVDLFTQSGQFGDAEGDKISGIRNVIGSAGADQLTGSADNNQLEGGAGADILRGLGGRDLLIGGEGADRLEGGDNIDTASYINATDGVLVDLTNNIAFGVEAAGDSFDSIENVMGGKFEDDLYGDDGANTLNGAAGDDFLVGAAGNDRLTGGTGRDIFAFSRDTGHDVVTDFAAMTGNGDLVMLKMDSNFDTYAEVMAVTSASGADTVIHFSADHTITLLGVSVGALTEGDFQFV